MTGESLPVHKRAGEGLPPDTPLAERRNMVIGGTVVTGAGPGGGHRHGDGHGDGARSPASSSARAGGRPPSSGR